MFFTHEANTNPNQNSITILAKIVKHGATFV